MRLIAEVVELGLCTGCGICAAVCPLSLLTMQLNPDGEFKPSWKGDCPECNLCQRVCPALQEEDPSKSPRQFLPVTPEALLGDPQAITTWGGFAMDAATRLRSSSGGILTLVLSQLLESRLVDAALVVGPAMAGSNLLFETRLVRSPEELGACAGSKYYPVELSRALRELRSTGERAAVVGLPCHVSGLRRLQACSPHFRKQIRFILGLTCGHGVTAHFTEMLMATVAAIPGEIDRLSYRDKDGAMHARDSRFSVFKNNRVVGSLRCSHSLYISTWTRHLFVPPACNFCDDVFAYEADASFMDAWLPEYDKDPQGTSLIVSRSEEVTKLLQGLKSDDALEIWEVSAHNILRSQPGGIRYKRELMPARLFEARRRGQAVPVRLRGLAARGSRAQRRENRRYLRNGRLARAVWLSPLPAWIRLKIIGLLFQPGLCQCGKSLLKHLIGTKRTATIKKIMGII